MMILKAKTALALGVHNLARVFVYQLGVKLGLNPVKRITGELKQGDFFAKDISTQSDLPENTLWLNKHCYFGVTSTRSGLPNWHESCLTQSLASSDLPWFSLGDFDNELGDIKGVWEASRFDWAISLAQSAKRGDADALTRLNFWLNDWVQNNPAFMGTNWKCGQEASIRVMHLALASLILGQVDKAQPALLSFVRTHLRRISPTIMYAVAQDNNHGTSEAAALYIGGSWLAVNGDADGIKWQKQGVKWLENRAKRLIERDGSFSQYSVNYHRVMLDTYCLLELWRRHLKLSQFSSLLYDRLQAASKWLYYFTIHSSGDAPNLGANDGARLLPMTNSGYRDFRPSVQLANALFNNAIAYPGEGEFNAPLKWMNLSLPDKRLDVKKPTDFTDGGYCFLGNERAEVFFNYPCFKFRPSQCDALHLDFWIDGINVIRDGGTYSYNAGQSFIDYYAGTESHSTVAFDRHEQMPRLSRFLLGNWLKTINKKALRVSGGIQSVAAGYRDAHQCVHDRSIELRASSLLVKDVVSGFNERAISRLRLAPLAWQLNGNELVSDVCTIKISADIHIERLELVNGKESRFYYQESDIPVLELEVHEAGVITMEIHY
ncbi:heparinase II/III family protein [Pseudoalteromonas piscicida]|uniref:Heparinase n=1 Tax=Pseudoalteromonas piscicida TaxID=43662 RepID=A0AAD0RGE4_PSEO7|nr:heparinase II/III family protein [Pseudoalteromonas piscicida]ASD68097.1 heparinase [Pseudoalteromonas piscicida]AXR01194.1 heparinase [Pseudoalteromonas piscicida]